MPVLATKLYLPSPRPKIISRPRLVERLNEGLTGGCKLILISASAGFGKTTLVSSWIDGLQAEAASSAGAAWLSLDEGDNDPARFLTYFISSLQTLAPNIGARQLIALQAPQPPSNESLLTSLLNEITTIADKFILVLDDYHVIDSKEVDNILAFLLEHLPPKMHLVIATREDPHLPLARLRAQARLIELRAADLRFTPSEAAIFLNHVIGLNITAEDIAALDERTEGWIAGLQLAALSMQGHPDVSSFIKAFTGSHYFVLDYLMEEVLQQQSESTQTFLLCTSILERMCGPLCDAVLISPIASGQKTLEYLEHANLFIVPLDNERRWYRYHHLFADLLRQRLSQQPPDSVAQLHMRASQWYEDNDLELEAFHHAVAANDIQRAARLVEGRGVPLHFRGAVGPVLSWIKSLPPKALDARPSLWVMYASVLSMTGQTTSVEEKLQAAEAALAIALQGEEPDDKTRNLIGHIAAIRALLAATQNQAETIIAQSRRALEYLHPDNLAVRTATIWKLGLAYQLQGERSAARRAYTEAISVSQASGNNIVYISATTGLGSIQEADNQLYLADQTYRRVLQLAGDPPLPVASEAHLGLARILYEWNDLDSAEWHRQQSAQLAPQLQNTDRSVACEMFLARLKLARGDVAGASAVLAETAQFVRQHNFAYSIPELVSAQVLVLLRQGNLEAATQLVQTHELPLSRARVLLARGNVSAALGVLESFHKLIEARGWEDELLKVMVLQAVALRAHGEKNKAVQVLGDALALAEPGGFIRIFIDEGPPIAQLLSDLTIQGVMSNYARKLLAVYQGIANNDEEQTTKFSPPAILSPPLVEPLSQRELEVLQLIADGLSNHEISERLFLALDTVKGHNRKIYDKLQVQRRTEAVARARELGLL